MVLNMLAQYSQGSSPLKSKPQNRSLIMLLGPNIDEIAISSSWNRSSGGRPSEYREIADSQASINDHQQQSLEKCFVWLLTIECDSFWGDWKINVDNYSLKQKVAKRRG